MCELPGRATLEFKIQFRLEFVADNPMQRDICHTHPALLFKPALNLAITLESGSFAQPLLELVQDSRWKFGWFARTGFDRQQSR